MLYVPDTSHAVRTRYKSCCTYQIQVMLYVPDTSHADTNHAVRTRYKSCYAMLRTRVGIIISYFQEVKFEMSAYHHVAMAATSFAFQSSHWNKKCGRSQCILQGAEVTAGSEVLQTIIIIQL